MLEEELWEHLFGSHVRINDEILPIYECLDLVFIYSFHLLESDSYLFLLQLPLMEIMLLKHGLKRFFSHNKDTWNLI